MSKRRNTNVHPKMDLEILARMETEEPIAVYVKKIVGKLGVLAINPVTGEVEDLLLAGDPRDPKANVEKMTVRFWDKAELAFFERANRRLIEEGKLVPFTKKVLADVQKVNAITDEEIDRILGEPFFTLKNKLNEFTKPTPVQRILIRAIERDTSVSIVNHIKARLAELQQAEGLAAGQLEEYYKNLETN